jgi:hypothetical protein
MRWGNSNACEVQVRKAVGIHLLKNSRCRSDGDINAVPKEPGNGAIDWIHLDLDSLAACSEYSVEPSASIKKRGIY